MYLSAHGLCDEAKEKYWRCLDWKNESEALCYDFRESYESYCHGDFVERSDRQRLRMKLAGVTKEADELRRDRNLNVA